MLFALFKPYRGRIALLLLLTLFSNGLSLLLPTLIQQGIDAFSQGQSDFNALLLPFLLCSLGLFGLTSLQNALQVYTGEKAAKDLRNQLATAISQLSYPELARQNPAKMLTHLTSDIEALKVFVSQALSSILSSLVLIVGASALLLNIHWQLALVILTVLPLIALAFYLVFSRVKTLFRKSQEIIDGLNRVINESILGAALIRVLNAQKLSISRFETSNQAARSNSLNILKLFAALVPIVSFVAGLGSLGILLLGGHFVIEGSLSLGAFAAFNAYLGMVIFPIVMLGFMSNLIARASASYARISPLLHAEPVKAIPAQNHILTGDIQVRALSYQPAHRPVLNALNFQIKAGSRTAILGPTAAGKSSLLALLVGLLPADSGEISYGPHPLSEIAPADLYRQVGMVFQDSALFNLSLRDNIAFNREVSPAALHKALETAELLDFVETLPKGLDTLVSERGLNLSGGQKQRIILARALAIEPTILLLDDFTARVDARTEQRILGNLKQNYPHLTLISVTQKIEPIMDYDLILLLMEGQLLAQGRHTDLLHSSPEYSQIYQSQHSTQNFESGAAP
ncbi:MAG: ABC transporter ATP-binding protein [Candidatus Sericytochromatia bacterium]